MTKYLSTVALGIVGFVLVLMPMFVLADHDVAKYTTQVTGVTKKSDCTIIPGGKWHGPDPLPTPPPIVAENGCWLPGAGGATEIGGALQLVNRLTNWMVTILVLFGIFYGIIGAFQFLTSAGEEKKLETGKKKIYYAIGGVVLGLLVKGIITLLVNFVGTL